MTTTTTTTTLAPLSYVQTLSLEKINGQFVEKLIANASNDNDTIGNLHTNSLSFGTISPGELSKNLIVKLKVPNANAINNIKIGLIKDGGITFTNTTFGIIYLPYITENPEIDTYFQGISNGVDSIYNISINNFDNYSSYYVYLNINLPSDNFLGKGIIRYTWFFDYDD